MFRNFAAVFCLCASTAGSVDQATSGLSVLNKRGSNGSWLWLSRDSR